MKLAKEDWDFTINMESEGIAILTIESQTYLRNFIEDIYIQQNGYNGKLVLSKYLEILPISKHLEMIIDPFLLDLNNKKIINGLYKVFTKEIQNSDILFNVNDIQQKFEYIMQEVEFNNTVDIVWESSFDINKMLKFLDVKVDEKNLNIKSRIITYLKLYQEFVEKDVIFVCLNFKTIFSKEEYLSLIKMMQYEELKVLFVESMESYKIEEIPQWIIDKDGCFIY